MLDFGPMSAFDPGRAKNLTRYCRMRNFGLFGHAERSGNDMFVGVA
jgi:hypothetical protein